MEELQLSDFDIDRQLLALPGASLVIFTSAGCASCRWARQQLPGWPLPVTRLCWVDAGHNGGAVERYQIFHLPALFVVCEGQFLGQIHTRLAPADISEAITTALSRTPEDLP
ncbi:hypothetical protein SAMN04490205_3011 [Pseudomonas trivialis]|uniref:Thioredoxin n=1 Tax=Pseudomonas trivialis TaxID=200450 RepID=A0ABY0UFM1_9PSED|nr:hypothetical protein SAMN04490205_3011 [Pseudomonas trivialis]